MFKVTIADLKAHVGAFIAKEALGIDGEVHKVVAKFAEFVEGKQATADAVALLAGEGYTVTPPPTAA